jgi:phosphoglycolate phosphatase-like HAD superfamily hydrolase
MRFLSTDPRARARHTAVALLVGAALALGACGDDDESTTVTDATTSQTSTDSDDVVSTTLDPDDADATPPELPMNDDPSAVQCTGPPEAVFDATAIVGDTVKDATAAASAKGCSVRVVVEDGKPLAATQDFRPDRVNVVVEDGVVTKIDSLG